MKDPAEINIAISRPADKILQMAYIVYEEQKNNLIFHLLQNNSAKSILVFCSTKSATKELNGKLKSGGLNVGEIHSDMDQKDRENILLQFKSKNLQILIATDILSRGIDIEDIDMVINFDVPNDAEDYIHRIGRTARAEAEGVALTLINEKDQFKFSQIEKLLEKNVHKAKLPAFLGEAPVYDPKLKKKKKFKFKKKKTTKSFKKKKK